MTAVGVITGAGGAMGGASALALAPTVDVILLTDLDELRLSASAERVERHTTAKVETAHGDIGEPGFVHELVARTDALGEFRALVHTAGLSPTMADWREIVRVDLAAVPLLLDSFLPSVVQGSVAVCIASIAGHVGTFGPETDTVCDDPHSADFEPHFRAVAGESPEPGQTYRLAKRAVIRYCERAAVVWGARGGRVVSLSPGLIDTEMGRLELEHNEIKRWMASITPVGRFPRDQRSVLPGRTDDIADAVEFLCSERAAFVSGCDLRVDGGLVAAMNHRLPET